MDTKLSRQKEGREPDRAASQLLEAVPHLRRIIHSAAQDDDSAGALTVTQLRVLARLVRGVQLPSELARALEITPATAGEVVDLLVRRGLVERRDQPGDRRCTPLLVTPAGLARWEAAMDRAMEALKQLLAGMEPAHRAALEEGLEALLERIGDRRRGSGGSENAD